MDACKLLNWLDTLILNSESLKLQCKPIFTPKIKPVKDMLVDYDFLPQSPSKICKQPVLNTSKCNLLPTYITPQQGIKEITITNNYSISHLLRIGVIFYFDINYLI